MSEATTDAQSSTNQGSEATAQEMKELRDNAQALYDACEQFTNKHAGCNLQSLLTEAQQHTEYIKKGGRENELVAAISELVKIAVLFTEHTETCTDANEDATKLSDIMGHLLSRLNPTRQHELIMLAFYAFEKTIVPC